MLAFAANLSMLFTEAPFLERFRLAGAAGFRGVEYLFPYAYSPEELKQALDANHLTQVLFNLPPGDWEAGERGIACHPDRVAEFRAGVDQAMVYAQALDCKRVNCLAGLLPEGVAEADAWSTLVANVGYAADKLGQKGITLCLEAINSRVDMPGFVLDTSARVMQLIESIDADNIKLQYDVYHMQVMEGDLIRTMECLLPWIAHLQIADNPGRHQPGTGEINFPRLFEALDRMGYEGWIGAEYRPLGTTSESLGWFRTLS